MKKPMEFLNLGSLITYKDEAGQECCLGQLMDFAGHGVFDPTLGKVDVSSEHVKAHNEALDGAMLKGLDENCQVGQGGTFYYIGGKVQTWLGAVVSQVVNCTGKSITFYRGGRAFRGRLQKDADCFNFRRIGDSRISTVFLGLDHNWSGRGRPVLWESMVFGGKLDQEQDRCSGSREQAEVMHARMVERVKGKL
jgi:hypothetical protein